MTDQTPLPGEIVAHEHCAEGVCESCDCCAAGWCVAFQDGDPYPQQFYGYSEPYSARLIADARDTFDLWASMVLDAWGVEARPLAENVHRLASVGRIYDTCLCGWYGSNHPAHVEDVVQRLRPEGSDR